MKMNKMKVLTSALNAAVITGATSVVLAGGGGIALPAEVITAIKNVLSAVRTVGIFVAIAMVMWAGFKFLVAGAGEKAKAKEMLVPMVIGALLIIFATSLAEWLWVNVLGGEASGM